MRSASRAMIVVLAVIVMALSLLAQSATDRSHHVVSSGGFSSSSVEAAATVEQSSPVAADPDAILHGLCAALGLACVMLIVLLVSRLSARTAPGLVRTAVRAPVVIAVTRFPMISFFSLTVPLRI